MGPAGVKFSFLHAADIHLDSPLRGLERYEGAPAAEIRAATRQAFDNLITLAIDEAVDFVLLAGDLYDGDWKDYNTGLYFVSRMARLREAGIRVFLIAGNHDAASQITKQLQLPDNVTRFATSRPETVTIEELNVAIHGQGFPTREVTEDLSQNYPQGDPQRFNIGLLHTSLDGKPGHEPYAPCHVDGLRAKGYQYWALGHVHKRELISEEPYILFPGNIQGRHIRETGARGCTLVRVENGEVVQLEQRDIDVLRWSLCPVDISGCDQTETVLERVQAAFRQVLDEAEGRPVAARLLLQGESTMHARLHAESQHWTQEFRALATGLGGAGLWLEKLSLQTRLPADAAQLQAREDALGGLLQAIREMELNEADTTRLAEQIAALQQKLPPELNSGNEHFDPTGKEQLESTLEDVKQLLVTRLLAVPGS